MSIERQTIPYEILIRLNADGYVASHVCDLEQVIDTESGETIAEKELPARPVTLKEAKAYLGDQNVRLIAQLDAAAAKQGEIEDALAVANQRADSLEADLTQERGARTNAEAELTRLRALVSDRLAAIAQDITPSE